MEETSQSQTSSVRVEERPWYDPREGHWPVAVAAAAMSLTSSYCMAPVFQSSLRKRFHWVALAAVGSFAVCGLHWQLRVKNQPSVHGGWLACPESDVAKAGMYALFTAGVIPAYAGGYAVGQMTREIQYTGREIFIYAGPIWRNFVSTRMGGVRLFACSLLGFLLMKSLVKHHVALAEQDLRDQRAAAPALNRYKT